MPKLSVVIPVYNAKKYLIECVGSVLAQTYHDTEIILVDDGSNDGSDQLCDELFAKHGDIIRVIHQENGGASSARNSGLRAARGDYVHFIDSDDLLSRDTVHAELMAKAEESSPEIIFFRRERFIDGQKEIDAINTDYLIKHDYIEEGVDPYKLSESKKNELIEKAKAEANSGWILPYPPRSGSSFVHCSAVSIALRGFSFARGSAHSTCSAAAR